MADEEPFSDVEHRRAGRQYLTPQERRDRAAAREAGRREREAYESGRAERQRSTAEQYARRAVPKGEAARRIVGLMGITVVFALISDEIAVVSGKRTTTIVPGPAGPVPVSTNGVRIVIGGAVATAILLVLTEVGDDATELAQGLALTAMVATLFIKGAPVWNLITRVQSGTVPLTPVSPTTPSSAAPGGEPLPPTGNPPGTLPGGAGGIVQTGPNAGQNYQNF
jgi:hypothetical protein